MAARLQKSGGQGSAVRAADALVLLAVVKDLRGLASTADYDRARLADSRVAGARWGTTSLSGLKA